MSIFKHWYLVALTIALLYQSYSYNEYIKDNSNDELIIRNAIKILDYSEKAYYNSCMSHSLMTEKQCQFATLEYISKLTL